MKTTLRLYLTALALLALAVTQLHAQNYSLAWSPIAGGGGTSTGGVFAVSGTIGQVDAGGPLTGGPYSLVGGFWSIVAAVQSPGAPLLTVTQNANGSVTVSWPSPATGFVLQHSPDLGPDHWLDAVDPIAEGGTTRSITIPTPAGTRFFRLQSSP